MGRVFDREHRAPGRLSHLCDRIGKAQERWQGSELTEQRKKPRANGLVGVEGENFDAHLAGRLRNLSR